MFWTFDSAAVLVLTGSRKESGRLDQVPNRYNASWRRAEVVFWSQEPDQLVPVYAR